MNNILDLENVLLGTTRKASYFRGVVKIEHPNVINDEFNESISLLRSWQHKESRRSTGNEYSKLNQCVLLQLSNGFLDTSLRYFAGTIFAEDIGLANPSLIIKLLDLYNEARKMTNKTTINLNQKQAKRLIRIHLRMAQMVGQSKKSRFVASWATIGLISCAKSWNPDIHWKTRTENLKHTINTCRHLRSQNKLSYNNNKFVLEASVALESLILSVPASTKSRLVSGAPKRITECWKDIWSTIIMCHDDDQNNDQKSNILSCAFQMNKNVGPSRLLMYFALLVVCYRKEHTKEKKEEKQNEEDINIKVNTLFPRHEKLPHVPRYAMDKHVGKTDPNDPGGYKRFQSEGIFVPLDMAFLEFDNKALSDASFEMRFSYESKFGPGSSKSKKIKTKILDSFKNKNKTKETKETKQNKKRKFLSGNVEKKNKNKKQKMINSTEPNEQPKLKNKLKQNNNKKRKSYNNFFNQISMIKKQKIKTQNNDNTDNTDNPVVAQCITGRHKKYVSVYEDVVKKGPYLTTKVSDQSQLNMNIEMTKLVKKIDIERGLSVSVLDLSVETDKTDGTKKFLVWPNIGDFSKLQSTLRTTKLDANKKVATRRSFVDRVGDLRRDELTSKIMDQTLNHCYARFILGIGDTHPANLLVKYGTSQVYGVDMEEKRGIIKNNDKMNNKNDNDQCRLNLLFTRKVRDSDLWKTRIKHVKTVTKKFAQDNLPPKCADRVSMFEQV